MKLEVTNDDCEPGSINTRAISQEPSRRLIRTTAVDNKSVPELAHTEPLRDTTACSPLAFTHSSDTRRPPRQRPSIASDALSAVTGALTSIALYDDQQCVPRLLCEAAGGGALGSSGILQTLSGIQPLLTLLSAYNGISSNPLFVFGRAVFLGMSSNGNTASCRYAYPLCPTDPEQLVYYLNNHNGGFFRFFNSPQQGQQNVEQFYNQLTQNYGLYQQGQPQNYGFYNPNPAQNYGFHKPNPYQGDKQGLQQNYGLAFPYGDNNIRFKNSYNLEISKGTDKVQRRIQNNPISQDFVYSGDFNTKWMFPETVENSNTYYVNNDLYKYKDFYENNVNSGRDVNVLKFPDSNQDSVTEIQGYDRKIRGFKFPESNSNTHYNDYNYVKSNEAYNDKFTYNNKYYGNKYVYKGNNNADDLRGVRTVYIVRGNGDPSNPEIIKLRPGETIQ
ncbi:uncharacterized protein LOC135193876 [Vanessa tameamea]|uniref:Uncharacterized protein LOC135193876 n=1 Tax=Vanessa tameamea TaxID=334116 RepID=A0ABM4ASD8_VANTA